MTLPTLTTLAQSIALGIGAAGVATTWTSQTDHRQPLLLLLLAPLSSPPPSRSEVPRASFHGASVFQSGLLTSQHLAHPPHGGLVGVVQEVILILMKPHRPTPNLHSEDFVVAPEVRVCLSARDRACLSERESLTVLERVCVCMTV